MNGLRIAVLSLEPWDEVWRRNQHFAYQLLKSGAATTITFVSPPHGGLQWKAERSNPLPGLEVVVPPLWIPRRAGGHVVLGAWLKRLARTVDVVWINDPVAGATVARAGKPAIYDVTDDWRSMRQSERDRTRIVRAEGALAREVPTVVCSDVLAERWLTRYGVTPKVIHNGVDVDAIDTARLNASRKLDGPGPHAVYVGTVHPNRVDVELLIEFAERWPGTVHLVGPCQLGTTVLAELARLEVEVHGQVPSCDVPSWLVAADVLICPHIVDEFTLSLDAIKAHEYLATDRPVIATPSCGFQRLAAIGLSVVPRDEFVSSAIRASTTGPYMRAASSSWVDQTAMFAVALSEVAAERSVTS